MMTYFIRLSTFFLALMIMLALVGCKGGSSGFMEQHITRSASLEPYGLHWPDPLDVIPEIFSGDTVGYRVTIMVGEVKDQGVTKQNAVTSVEIDPGDGNGFLDFTQMWKDIVVIGSRDPVGSHVYQEPGEYIARLRVTYWDGEVLDGVGLGQKTITILPPPDADE